MRSSNETSGHVPDASRKEKGKQMLYPDAVNPEVLKRIPLNARKVLDIGCGSGATGLAFKQQSPACQYFGIEKDPQAAEIAATRFDLTLVLDIEAADACFPDHLFDCIIFGDILEHLVDPLAVLTKYVPRLAAGGVVVICMPNAEHWSFAATLLRGGLRYQPMGLFDSSHLRWFTFQSTGEMIEAAGLRALDVASRVFDLRECQSFVEQLAPALPALGIDRAEYLNRAAPLQHVWRAQVAPAAAMNVVSTMLEHVGGVSEVRVVEPMQALASLPDMFTLIATSNELPPFVPDSPKIFIFHRPLLVGEEGLLPVRQLIELGYLVVCEFDDHPDYIPVLQRPDVQNFRAMHAIQTTTPALAAVLSQQNPEIQVFSNACARILPARNFADPGHMTLFFGGINREEEWPAFMPTLNAVARAVGDRLRFEVVSDQGFFDALDTPHKNSTPLCDYAAYKEILSRCEISFMPLRDTPFNRCKSDLKFLEASAHRVAALASPTVYGGVINDGETGLIFEDADGLRDRLIVMLGNPGMCRRVAESARDYVSQHRMLASQVGERAAWYRSLWERRHELNDTLLRRVPELAPAGGLPSIWTR